MACYAVAKKVDMNELMESLSSADSRQLKAMIKDITRFAANNKLISNHLPTVCLVKSGLFTTINRVSHAQPYNSPYANLMDLKKAKAVDSQVSHEDPQATSTYLP